MNIKIGKKFKAFTYFPTANAYAPGQIFDLTKATAMSGCIFVDCLTVHGITESTIASSDNGIKRGGPISFNILTSSSFFISSSSSSSSITSYVIKALYQLIWLSIFVSNDERQFYKGN